MPHPCAPTGAFSLGPRVDVNQTRLDQSIMRSDSLGFNLTNWYWNWQRIHRIHRYILKATTSLKLPGILKHAQGWAERVNLAHSHKKTTRATVDFHRDSSAAVAAFFKVLLWRGILRADTDVQEPSRAHFRIPEFVPLKDCLSYSNNSRRRHCTGVAAIWDIIKPFLQVVPPCNKHIDCQAGDVQHCRAAMGCSCQAICVCFRFSPKYCRVRGDSQDC